VVVFNVIEVSFIDVESVGCFIGRIGFAEFLAPGVEFLGHV